MAEPKEKRLEYFFYSVACFVGYAAYKMTRSEGILPSFVFGGVGAIMILAIYRFGSKMGKMKAFKGAKNVLTQEMYLSNKICVNSPQCGRSLKGATRQMMGDTGVCPKCKAEFEIKQTQ